MKNFQLGQSNNLQGIHYELFTPLIKIFNISNSKNQKLKPF